MFTLLSSLIHSEVNKMKIRKKVHLQSNQVLEERANWTEDKGAGQRQPGAWHRAGHPGRQTELPPPETLRPEEAPEKHAETPLSRKGQRKNTIGKGRRIPKGEETFQTNTFLDSKLKKTGTLFKISKINKAGDRDNKIITKINATLRAAKK